MHAFNGVSTKTTWTKFNHVYLTLNWLMRLDTPTNGKGGILKHTSQFDSPSTAKVSGV